MEKKDHPTPAPAHHEKKEAPAHEAKKETPKKESAKDDPIIPRLQASSAAFGMDWSKIWGTLSKLSAPVKEIIVIIMEHFQTKPMAAQSGAGPTMQDCQVAAELHGVDATELYNALQQFGPETAELLLGVLKSPDLAKL